MPSKKVEWQKHQRAVWRAKGLCWHCGREVHRGKTYCLYHLRLANQATHRQKRRWLEDGKCWSCGRPRADEGRVTDQWFCPTCRERTYALRVMRGDR